MQLEMGSTTVPLASIALAAEAVASSGVPPTGLGVETLRAAIG